MSEPTPYTPEELAVLFDVHARANVGYPMCDTCRADWPCPTARLLTTVHELQGGSILDKNALRRLKATVEAKDAEIRRLEVEASIDREVCICGCPVSQHESYDDDGESCGDQSHECVRVCPTALSIAQSLREQLRQQTERAEKAEARVDVQKRASVLVIKSATASYQSIEAENAALKAQLAIPCPRIHPMDEVDKKCDEIIATLETERHINESLHSTIEAQGWEIAESCGCRFQAGDTERKVLKQYCKFHGPSLNLADEVSEMASMYAKGLEDQQKLATKDAILRECAKTFREYERIHRAKIFCLGFTSNAVSEFYAALAAKCETALGEK